MTHEFINSAEFEAKLIGKHPRKCKKYEDIFQKIRIKNFREYVPFDIECYENKSINLPFRSYFDVVVDKEFYAVQNTCLLFNYVQIWYSSSYYQTYKNEELKKGDYKAQEDSLVAFASDILQADGLLASNDLVDLDNNKHLEMIKKGSI